MVKDFEIVDGLLTWRNLIFTEISQEKMKLSSGSCYPANKLFILEVTLQQLSDMA